MTKQKIKYARYALKIYPKWIKKYKLNVLNLMKII